MTTPTPAKTEYYKAYEDATADMVLEVKGRVKFRVHSYLLKAHSQFFRDMPDHDEKLCGTTSRIVHFDVNPAPFALLLHVIDNITLDDPHTWSEYAAVIELGVKYGFFHLVPLFLRYTKSNKPTGNPWTVFVVASTHDIPLLARWSLANFEDSQFWARNASDITPKDMERLSGKYATAFTRALKASRSDGVVKRLMSHDDGRQEFGQHNDWLGISRNLDLEKYIEWYGVGEATPFASSLISCKRWFHD